MKRILIFFDGTWNAVGSGEPATNVAKLYEATPGRAGDGTEQVAHYEVGIATEKSYGRLAFPAGAIGIGVTERIQSGYRFLVETYEPGDEIYLLGFSRGAFQARSLGGLISLVGVMQASSVDRVPAAWAYYQESREKPDPGRLADLQSSAHHGVRIRLIGVWDTVGNLGLPLVPRAFDSRELIFHNTQLSAQVDVGLHALAIDEPRGPFRPTLWTRRKGASLPRGQIIEQVWFPGCHANVGGGYADSTLSDISLLWMAERAMETTGVDFDLAKLRAVARPDPMGEAVHPITGTIYRIGNVVPFVRLIGQDARGLSPWRRLAIGRWRASVIPADEETVNETIHDSARQRFRQKVKVRRGERVRLRRYKPRPLRIALQATPSP